MIGFREEISFQSPFNFISYFFTPYFNIPSSEYPMLKHTALRVTINLRERRNIIKTPTNPQWLYATNI